MALNHRPTHPAIRPATTIANPKPTIIGKVKYLDSGKVECPVLESAHRHPSVPKASQTPSFAPHPQTLSHSLNRTPLASPCPKEIFRCQIPFPKTQPQTYCRACSVRKIFFSVQKSAFYACKNRVNFRDKVNGISPHKEYLYRGSRSRTVSFCRFSPAVSKRSPVSRSAPALVYTSVTVGPFRSGQSGYLHCGTPVPVPRSNANSAPCRDEGSSAGLSSSLHSTATAKTSHLRTKDARTYTSHTPRSHEPRTQTVRISYRDTPSSYAFRTSIAPASMSSGRFKTWHTTTAYELSTFFITSTHLVQT